MQIKKLQYDEKIGWTDDLPTDLDSKQTLVLIFGASVFSKKPEPLKELIKKFPKSKLIGCSTGGEIYGSVVTDNCLSVAVVRFESTVLKQTAMSVFDQSESYAVGKNIADELSRADLQGIFVLSDSTNISGDELIDGINSQVGDSVSVTGGFAASGKDLGNTWVCSGDVPENNLISAIGFYGDKIKIGYGSRDGLDILGIEQRITKSDKNQLFEIDGKPALELYREYLGEKARELPQAALHFPISVRANLRSEKRIIRSVTGIDEENRSLMFAGSVPEGSMARLMIANPDRVIDGAAEAAMMTEQYGQNPEKLLSIAISCVGRRLLLNDRSEEELEAVLDSLPKGTEQVGFYSRGEICPYSVGSCDLHNQTMTLTTISEE